MTSTRTRYVDKRRKLIIDSIMLLIEMYGWTNKDLERVPLDFFTKGKKSIEKMREWEK